MLSSLWFRGAAQREQRVLRVRLALGWARVRRNDLRGARLGCGLRWSGWLDLPAVKPGSSARVAFI